MRTTAAVLLLHGLLALTGETWAAAGPVLPSAGQQVLPGMGQIEAHEEALYVNRRLIVKFRSALLDAGPAERAQRAAAALTRIVSRDGPGLASVWTDGTTAAIKLDGDLAFYLLPGDVGAEEATSLESAADGVRGLLQQAMSELLERGDMRRIGFGLLWVLVASALAVALINRLFWFRRKSALWLEARFSQWQRDRPPGDLLASYVDHTGRFIKLATRGITWLLFALLLDTWLTFSLHQFAYTRPWGERSTEWLTGVLEQTVLSIASAVPGLVIVILIVLLARMASRALRLLLERAERGESGVDWLDVDTIGPTRRLGNLVIWLFALAMAYPYLPGSHSEAFKGVSVLAGLMLSLGASSVVGQVLSGFSLMYARVLRPGEYVKVGDSEGTVVAVGVFSTRIHTGMGEEVSIPNSVVAAQAVRNYSRLVTEGQFVVHTTVTIGYSTPWRQVHAMLLEAACRTACVARNPEPYVLQTALSDFYVEYRLCAQIDKSAPSRRAEALNQLHGNIQDVFNQYGVQIMSPHYMADTVQPQVVPRERWWEAPAERPESVSAPG